MRASLADRGQTKVISENEANDAVVLDLLDPELPRLHVAAGTPATVAGVGPETNHHHRSRWASIAKRVLDVGISIIALAILSPIMLLVAVVITATSQGPVLFRQIRVGRGGRHFEVLKFRSMVSDAELRLVELQADNEQDGPLFKMRNDPRVTRFGRLLRRLSIDEVPQFINVLRGEMSLVGPRPALPAEMAAWPDELHSRLAVRPGITGLWQVSGRSDTSFDDYTKLDLEYVNNWSLRTDLKILAKTAPAVFRAAGAY